MTPIPLASLWLPILVSAVAVFILSSIVHMVLPYHRSDYKQIPDEDNALAGLTAAKLPPGLYVFPFCTHKDMKSPEIAAKRKRGPVGFMTLFPNESPAMGKFMALWFVFCVLVSIGVAFIACHFVPEGQHRRHVVRIVGCAAFLAYGLSNFRDGIWKGQPWGNVIKEMIDGLIYAAATALTFAYLWPH
jgi:hypothetical protein